MDAMWRAMRGRSFDALRLAVSDAVAEGYPMSAMLAQLHSDVLYKQGLPDIEKALICEKIAHVSQCLLNESGSILSYCSITPPKCTAIFQRDIHNLFYLHLSFIFKLTIFFMCL